MRLGIAWKLSVGASALVLLAVGLTAYLFYRNANAVLLEHELIDLQDETSLRGWELVSGLNRARADALALTGRQSTRDLASLLTEYRTAAPATRLKLDDRINTARKDFLRVAEELRLDRPEYTEIRLLQANGTILAQSPALDVDPGSVDPPSDLTDPGLNVVRKHPDRLDHVSKVHFEDGPDEQPWITTTAPIHGRDEIFGVVQIRIDFRALTAPFARMPRHLVYLVDNENRLLIDRGRVVPRDDSLQFAGDTELADLIAVGRQSTKGKSGEVVPAKLGDRARLDREPYVLVSSEALPREYPREKITETLDRVAEEFADRKVRVSRGGIYDIQRIHIRAPDVETLNEVKKAIEPTTGLDKLRADKGEVIRWHRVVPCETFYFHYVSLLADENGSKWGLAMGVAEEEIQSDIQESFWNLIILTVALAGTSAVIALLGSLALTRPLRRMIWASEKIAAGEEVDLAVPGDRSDEIGVLARSFRRMVDALKESALTMRSILDGAGDAIITLDPKGKIKSFNRAAQLIFGYPEREAQTKHYRDLVPRRQSLFEIESAMTTATGMNAPDNSSTFHKSIGVTRELLAARRDGSTFSAEVTISDIPMGDRRLYTVILRDVTQRKEQEEQIRRLNEGLEQRVRERTAELEQVNHSLEHARDMALEASRAKDAFLATMSHELRTPLNAIIGYCEFLQEDLDEDDETASDLRKIEQAGKHLLSLINDILDLAKIEAGKLQLEPRDFDIRPLMNELSDLMMPLVKARKNQFILDCPDDIGTMHSDRLRVRQVILNLLSNANKFTDAGTVTLRVHRETKIEGEDQDWLMIQVTDTGRGMKPDEVKKLFTAFYQADSSSTRKHEGTGLGLAITRRLCNLMGGDIHAESTFGEGATFTVRLPVRMRSLERRSFSSLGRAGTMRPVDRDSNLIVVIDDDPDVRELMERFLTKEGYEVRCASSGEEGLQIVKETRPRAVTLDAMMPGIDGWAVLAALKSDPETAAIPIIMATIVDDRTRGFALGATDYLTKPIEWERLSQILGQHRLHEQGGPVLVVEDDPPTRELLMRMLEKNGWPAMEASNGRIALERMTESRPGLILLDLMMPEMDGFQFVEALRDHPEWRDVPVVVITAVDLTDEDRQRLNGRVRQVIQKGAFSPEQLLEAIRDQVKALSPANRGES